MRASGTTTDHYLRSLRSTKGTTDHYLRSLRQVPVDHYLRSLRQAPVDHYLRSLRQAPVDHYLRSLRQAPVDHYLRSLREDSDTTQFGIDDEEPVINSKTVRDGLQNDHTFRSRRSVATEDKGIGENEIAVPYTETDQSTEKDRQGDTMPSYWDQSLRTVRF